MPLLAWYVHLGLSARKHDLLMSTLVAYFVELTRKGFTTSCIDFCNTLLRGIFDVSISHTTTAEHKQLQSMSVDIFFTWVWRILYDIGQICTCTSSLSSSDQLVDNLSGVKARLCRCWSSSKIAACGQKNTRMPERLSPSA